MKAKKYPPQKPLHVLLPIVLGIDTFTCELHPKEFIMRVHFYMAERKTQKPVKPPKHCGPQGRSLCLTHFDVLSTSGGRDEAAVWPASWAGTAARRCTNTWKIMFSLLRHTFHSAVCHWVQHKSNWKAFVLQMRKISSCPQFKRHCYLL